MATTSKSDWSSRLLDISKGTKNKGGAAKDKTRQKEQDWEEGDEEEEVTGKRSIPAEMRCFDTARIYLKSGDGGNGCVAFRREKFIEHGGPSGGNGGRGGNVWAIVDEGLGSLTSFRQKVHWKAQSGVNGQGSSMHGMNAEDLYIPVPAGTIIRLKDAQEGDAPLAELVKAGDKVLLLVGGRGGRGNESFKTHSNNAPTIAERGEAGNEAWVDLELKVVADVGIIGVPNAGKSTLLSVVTSAKPKIANYPFTTLVPNLGVCEMDYRTTVFADVPGLLEGAHEGLGLGHEFLRHVQRCRALIHVIDGTSPDPMGDFRAINLELELFNPELKDKRQVVAYNKIDVPDSGDFAEVMREELMAEGVAESDIFAISAATGQGVLDLVRRVRSLLDEMGPVKQVYETNALNKTKLPPRVDLTVRLDDFTIDTEPGPKGTTVYFVEGAALNKFAQMTNWDYYEAVKRFQRVLDAAGINAALRARGVKEGDTVVINETELTWSDDQSDSALYAAFKEGLKAQGKNVQGSTKWPRQDGDF